MKKEGVIELQIKWVFVIIVGAAFLLFFTQVVQKQTELGYENERSRAVKAIAESFSGSGTIRMSIPEGMRYDCEAGKLVLGKSSLALKGVNVFAPRQISSSQLRIARAEIKMPFLIGKAVIIVPEEEQIVVAAEGATADIAVKIKELYGSAVSFGALKSGPGENVSLLAIVVRNGAAERAVGLQDERILFLENNGNWEKTGDEDYLGPELFSAAIASDHESYVCSVRNMLSGISSIARNYEKKAEKLQSKECDYKPLTSQLRIMESGKIMNAGKELETLNQVLANESCEVLY